MNNILNKLTKGDQIRFKDNTVLWFSKNLNGQQGFFNNEYGTGNYRKDYSNIISINGKKLQEKMNLKQTLLEEIEDIIQSQKQEVLTFESDPIEYIIQKYPSLDATMIDLMTEVYRDYITGIYVMAPKPTTFKILLHNGQFFYLIYDPKGYIAKVSGKKYYLMNLNEEEYAIKSIADLLLLGIPPGSEGPGEEEQNNSDPKDQFAADMTSEPELGDEETPSEEPEEELQENEEIKIPTNIRIVK